jgi:hypothetical protein
MRSLFGWPLLLSSLGLSDCTAPTAESTSSTIPVAAPAHGRVSTGSARVGIPGPDAAHQRVQAEDIMSGDTVYAATLPVLNDPDGSLRIRIQVNPQAHTLEKITVLSTPHQATVSYKQVGEGVGKYEPTTGHYYFLTAYQKIRQLPAGLTDYGSLQEIGGWVKPGAATAAVAHNVAR